MGSPARLASLLLRLAAERGTDEITGLTHQDLAETIGTYRETATQVLNDMKLAGIIEITDKTSVSPSAPCPTPAVAVKK